MCSNAALATFAESDQKDATTRFRTGGWVD